MKHLLLVVAALVVACVPTFADQIETLVITKPIPDRTVIVVLFDGFAPAELDAAHPTPNFDRLKREGAWSRHLVPAFPTISLINHTTFLTGCWPEHHGIMSNVFIDPKLGRFGLNGPNVADADWRTGCQTIWEAAERQGTRAAAFNFIDRWSSKTGRRATYVNDNVPWEQRESDDVILNKALKLLKDGGVGHARLISLYFNIPDHVAHTYGVTGPETQDAVKRADAIVGRLLAALKALPPGREGALVVGTDHGMMDVGPIINFGRIMHDNDIHGQYAADGASVFLYLDKSESRDRVEKAMKQYGNLFTVYRTGHYPAFAHLGNGPRVGDLMLLTHPPYWVADAADIPSWTAWLGMNWLWPVTFTPVIGGVKATHGYDPRIGPMHGIFYAWGAGVTPGEVKRLDQIDVHPTVMKLLGLQPGKPVDGHPIAAVQ